MGEPRLYSSRITKVYVEYLRRYHPEVNIDHVLEPAGMARCEVEDPAQWFTQEQVDRFHDSVTQATGNPAISREAGRYAALSSSMGPLKRYVLGFMNPDSVCMLAGKAASLVTRATRVEVQKQGPRLIEFTASPRPGVREKPFQCENRLGSLESIGLIFSETLARVDHPECVHRGGDVCRYLIRVPRLPFMPWKQARNALSGLVPIALALTFFACSLELWILLALASTLAVTLVAWRTAVMEKKDLARLLREQSNAAREQVDEMKIRADHALLFQEIGQAATSPAHEDARIRKILGALEKRLDFDCGVLLLAGEGETHLTFAGGFGIPRALESRFRSLCLPRHTLAQQKIPILVDVRSNAREQLPADLFETVRELGVHEGICAPMLYESKPLGVLLVFHTRPKGPLTQSDLRLLEGAASHTATSIVNARAYRRLEVSEGNYRELVQAANSVILRADPTGRITFINHFAQKLFGLEEAHILGRNVIGTILTETQQASWEMDRLVQKLCKGSSHHVVTESKYVRSNGDEIRITWTHRPLFDENGELTEILSIGNDITELYAARQEKAQLTAHLQRSRRMEAVGALSGGVAHELNNILSGIVSYPELLLMDLSPESPLRKPVETIQRAGEKAAGIVQDMLLLSRKGVASTENMNLNHLVHMYLDGGDHRDLAANTPKVRVELALEKGLPSIHGSGEHLARTLHCLLTNAYQAMPGGGVARVATEGLSLGSDYQGYEAVPAGDYVVLRVSDEGPLLGEDDLERVFEPFYTKKALKRPGAGLGLPVVWGIVKDHQGYVDVQSHSGGPTTFSLYLPAAVRNAEVFETLADDTGDIRGRGETVLVVDDVAEQRMIATEILERLGYHVVSLDSGEAALAFLQDHGGVDLLVLDMVIEPGMDGLETYRQAMAVYPGQKAIIASGYSETKRVREALRLGVGAYLKKPYNLNNLGRAVREELDRGESA